MQEIAGVEGTSMMRIRQNKLWTPRTLNISGFTKGELDECVCGSVSACR